MHMDWPSPLKNKGVFFVKREKVPLPEQMSDLLSWMCCGDIHPNPLDQFCGIVEEVYNPTFSCYQNMIKFPHCVSDGRKYSMTGVSLGSVFRHQETESRVGLNSSPDQRSYQGKDFAAFPPARSSRNRGRGEEGPGVRREEGQHDSQEQHRGDHSEVGPPGSVTAVDLMILIKTDCGGGGGAQQGQCGGAGGGRQPWTYD